MRKEAVLISAAYTVIGKGDEAKAVVVGRAQGVWCLRHPEPTSPRHIRETPLYKNSTLRQPSLCANNDVYRCSIGEGGARGYPRHVRCLKPLPRAFLLTSASAEWPRVLESVLQRLHDVCCPCFPLSSASLRRLRSYTTSSLSLRYRYQPLCPRPSTQRL